MRFLLLVMFLPFHILHAQRELKITALHRYTISRSDTLYQFYTTMPSSKISISKNRNYYWYMNDTILITQYGLNGKLLHGSFSVFYPNRNLKEQGNFKYGLKAGIWKSWQPDGRLQSIINYKNGLREGIFEEYGENKLIRQGKYRKDLLSGNVISYNKEGKEERLLYNQGNLVKQADSTHQKNR